MKRILLLLIGLIIQISNYSYAIEPNAKFEATKPETKFYRRMSLTNLSAFKYNKLSITQYESGRESHFYEPRDKFLRSAKKVGGDSLLTDTLYFDYADRYVRVILSFPYSSTAQNYITKGYNSYCFGNQDDGGVIGVNNRQSPKHNSNFVILSDSLVDGKEIVTYYSLNRHNEKKYFCEVNYPYPVKVCLSYENVRDADLEEYKRLIDDIRVDVIYRKDEKSAMPSAMAIP